MTIVERARRVVEGVFMYPAGVGVLGAMLALDTKEEFQYRVLGAGMAIVCSPFILVLYLHLKIKE